MPAITNDEQIFTAHLAALINLVTDYDNPRVNQVPLFMMSPKEIEEFETFIENSSDLDGGFETRITYDS